jgi:hypothetical protein
MEKRPTLYSKALTSCGVRLEIGNWKLEIWEVGCLQTGRKVIRYGLARHPVNIYDFPKGK